MSHGYGSPRGIIGVWLVAVSASLLMVLAPMASAAADPPAGGNSVTVSAAIKPVRIIVVNDRNQITEILSNGPSDVTPSVHRGTSEGEPVALTSAISKQYAAIMSRTDQHKTGAIYELQNSAPRKVPRFFYPTIISILMSGLHMPL